MAAMGDSDCDRAGLFGEDVSLEDSDAYASQRLEDDLRRLAQAIATLTPYERDLLLVQLFDKSSLIAISKLTNLPILTVTEQHKSMISHLLEALQKRP